jgi:peptidyl-prolyl cis-trans isomerase SurA
MGRSRLQGLAGLALGLVVAGCGAAPERPTLYGGPAQFSFPGPAADALARAQKPEPGAAVRTASAVSAAPERPALKFHGEEAARIAAVVNGEAVLMEEVEIAAAQYLASARTEAQRAEVLKTSLSEVIDREVVLQDAFARLSKGPGAKFLDKLKEVAREEFERQWMQPFMRANHIGGEEELKSFMRAHEADFGLFRRQWERRFLFREYMRQRVEPSLNRVGHEQIVEYYARHPEEFKVEDKVEWQDLFIAAGQHPTREDARKLAAVLAERVRRGEDFARLANEFDNGDAKFRGAEGQGSKRGEIRPSEAEAVLWQMRDGEVGPLIELPTGFHVIRLVMRTHAGTLPFNDEKVQKQIRDKLRGEVFEREMKRIIGDLRRKSVIEIAPVF